MKVFGIGLARTGSASLTVALRRLGFTAKHFPTSYDAIPVHDCLTDTSVTVGYQYLDFMFQDSRFVLTVREVEPWLESMAALLGHLHDLGVADRYHRLHYALYGTTVYDEERLREAHRRHRGQVEDYFRGRADLLVLDVTTGSPYAALADFLGRPAPGEPFPHVNDRAAMALTRPDFDR